MKVYISGKITGLRQYEAKRNFYEMEKMLIAHGVTDIFNPMREINQELPYEEQMRLCFEALKNCLIIVMHPNWKESPGAKQEFIKAKQLGLHIRYHDRLSDYKDIERMIERENRFIKIS